MTRSTLVGPQGKLVVDEGGTGDPAVLLVHCDCGNQTQWSEALDHLRLRRRAVAFDWRGLGLSETAANGDYSFAGRAEDVGAVIRTLGLTGCVLVGHSGGGIVALHYAAAQPATVGGLLLVDPATMGGSSRQSSAASYSTSSAVRASARRYSSTTGPLRAETSTCGSESCATPRPRLSPS